MTTDTDTAKGQAEAQLESIRELVAALQAAESGPEADAIDAALQAIEEDVLSVEVRSNWHEVGTTGEDAEYSLLLYTGGPAVRVRGSLGMFNEPDRAYLEYQDWGTPWEELWLSAEDEAIVLAYAQVFYFGG